MAFLDPVLSPLLQPLLNSSPFFGILIMAFIVSLLITLAYKFLTNQEEMKQLKKEQKEFQKRMKALRSHPEEMMKVQKEAMKKNMQYMKHSFKPTLITMLPLLLIFGWMTGHLSYEPIYPGETYSITAQFEDGVTGDAELVVDEGTEIINEPTQNILDGKVTWRLKSTKGDHFLKVKLGEEEQTKKVLITEELAYEDPVSNYQHSDIKQIEINYDKLKPAGQSVSLFGWKPGWLGWYIIFSVVFSIGLRKILKIY